MKAENKIFFTLMITTLLVIIIVSCRSSRVVCPRKKAMDVIASEYDLNGIPKNPKWYQQIKDGTLPIPDNICPVAKETSSDWNSACNCTSQPITFNHKKGCKGGHVNFMPVLYEGNAYWSELQVDDDMDIAVNRSDRALYVGVGGYDIRGAWTEFNSTEFLAGLEGSGLWWDTFYHIAKVNEAAAKQMLNGNYLFMVSLLGLDCEHHCYLEMHPLYAMFVNISQTPDQHWAVFVRNWGDGGACGTTRIFCRLGKTGFVFFYTMR